MNAPSRLHVEALGPAIGGFAYERIGFSRLAIAWAAGLIVVTWLVSRAGARRKDGRDRRDGTDARRA